jgi:hypothetical protein
MRWWALSPSSPRSRARIHERRPNKISRFYPCGTHIHDQRWWSNKKDARVCGDIDSFPHTVTMICGQLWRTVKAMTQVRNDNGSTSTRTVECIHVQRRRSPWNKPEVRPHNPSLICDSNRKTFFYMLPWTRSASLACALDTNVSFLGILGARSSWYERETGVHLSSRATGPSQREASSIPWAWGRTWARGGVGVQILLGGDVSDSGASRCSNTIGD